MTETWGGTTGRDERTTEDSDPEPERKLDLLIKQRDLMVREIAALQNRVAGLDLAIGVLREGRKAVG